MKTTFPKLLLLSFIAFTTLSHAFVVSQSTTPIDTSLQPSLTYNPSTSSINPFEMTSFSIGRSYPSYHNDIHKILKKSYFDNIEGGVYELKLEVPFHQKNTSFGLDCTIFNSKNTIRDPDSQFLSLTALDALLTFKLKLPLHTKIGDFALTITPKSGLIYILRSRDFQTDSLMNFGVVAGISTGIDYYFNQWLGIFIEHSIKYNHIRWFIEHEDLPYASTPSPYSYYTNAITVGIKTTF